MAGEAQRKRLKISERSVTVRLPSPLLKAIDDHAADQFAGRSWAVRKLLMRGLRATGQAR